MSYRYVRCVFSVLNLKLPFLTCFSPPEVSVLSVSFSLRYFGNQSRCVHKPQICPQIFNHDESNKQKEGDLNPLIICHCLGRVFFNFTFKF